MLNGNIYCQVEVFHIIIVNYLCMCMGRAQNQETEPCKWVVVKDALVGIVCLLSEKPTLSCIECQYSILNFMWEIYTLSLVTLKGAYTCLLILKQLYDS